ACRSPAPHPAPADRGAPYSSSPPCSSSLPASGGGAACSGCAAASSRRIFSTRSACSNTLSTSNFTAGATFMRSRRAIACRKYPLALSRPWRTRSSAAASASWTVNIARAWRRSPETRTCVTVMRPAPRTRGSLISSRASTSPRMARTSPWTRSMRWDTSLLPVLEVGADQLVAERLQLLLLVRHLRVAPDELQHLVQRRLDELPVAAHQRQPQHRPLPAVVLGHLGDRRVELVAHEV